MMPLLRMSLRTAVTEAMASALLTSAASLPRNASSASGRGRGASAGLLADGADPPSAARTSTRPIRTCTTSGAAGAAARDTARGQGDEVAGPDSCTGGRRDALTEAASGGGAGSVVTGSAMRLERRGLPA